MILRDVQLVVVVAALLLQSCFYNSSSTIAVLLDANAIMNF